MKGMKKILALACVVLVLAAAAFCWVHFGSGDSTSSAAHSSAPVSRAENAESSGSLSSGSASSGSASSSAVISGTVSSDREMSSAVSGGPSSGSSSPDDQEHPKAPELDYLQGLEVPPYSGSAYIMIHDGLPFFDTEVIRPESYEIYYDLDELGRCTLADAVVGKDLMPTSKRENISSVKPTGWQKSEYPQNIVDGKSLYNRCHLIAFGLCGENANPYNLVTGTRYFNTKGVNDFENMVIDYIRETNLHVRYRVTPVFTGSNLICDGQIIEAWSVEDQGEAICFCIYAYNVQPGVIIDYATGDNWLDPSLYPESEPSSKPESAKPESSQTENANSLLEKDVEGTYLLNTKSLKIHSLDCPNAASMSEKNRQIYTGSYNALIEQGYEPDHSCIHFP